MLPSLPITVLIAAKNEEANIGRCISALSPAARIILIDSHSKDNTANIAIESGVEVVQFDYQGGYPKKRQWALDQLKIETPWVLLLDADEVVPDELWDEISQGISGTRPPEAFLITKGFHFLGRKFRFGGFSHAAVLLFKTGKARFEHVLDEPPTAPDMEIHERLIVEGTVGRLNTPLIHEDFKGLDAYKARHDDYAVWEAKVRHRFLTTGQWGEQVIKSDFFGNTQERRRFLKELAIRMPFEPFLWFTYHFILKFGFLEGRAGFIASWTRAGYIAQVRRRLRGLLDTDKSLSTPS